MYRRVPACLLVIAFVAHVTARAASADDPVPGQPGSPGSNKPVVVVTRVQSGPSGVTIFISVSQSQPGSSTAPLAGSQSTPGSGGPACSAQPAVIGNASRSWFEIGAASHPDQVPYALWCNGAFQGIVWLPGTTNPGNVQVVVDPGGNVDPRSLVQSLLDSLIPPEIYIGVNPDTGLVALSSWFWVDGYDGAPVIRMVTLGTAVVEVELTAAGYRWSFGDGATLATTSVGRRYPTESDVRHTYEQSSLAAGGSYALRLAITFNVRFRVGDGPWVPLAPITRAFARDYPVQQAQAVLTSR